VQGEAAKLNMAGIKEGGDVYDIPFYVEGLIGMGMEFVVRGFLSPDFTPDDIINIFLTEHPQYQEIRGNITYGNFRPVL